MSEKLKLKLERLKTLISPSPPPIISVVEERDDTWIVQCLEGLKLIRFPLDGHYWLTDQNNFLNIVAWDWVDKKQYIVDRYDCENYAFSFKAHIDRFFGLNQVGIVLDYESGHGYNLVIFPSGNVMLYEPQSDSLFFIPERNKQLYALENATLLL